MKYRCIVADPPWEEHGGGNRGADSHYPTMPTAEIIDVMADALGMSYQSGFQPIRRGSWHHTGAQTSKVAASAHLWLWVTDTFMMNGDGHRVIDALGFRAVASWPWVKMDVDEDGEILSRVELTEADIEHEVADLYLNPSDFLQVGTGQYCRKCHEWLVLATRGRAYVPSPETRLPSVIFAPKQKGGDGRVKHSKKPHEAFGLVEWVSPGPRLEMFAREQRPGWDVWGNEV